MYTYYSLDMTTLFAYNTKAIDIDQNLVYLPLRGTQSNVDLQLHLASHGLCNDDTQVGECSLLACGIRDKFIMDRISTGNMTLVSYL